MFARQSLQFFFSFLDLARHDVLLKIYEQTQSFLSTRRPYTYCQAMDTLTISIHSAIARQPLLILLDSFAQRYLHTDRMLGKHYWENFRRSVLPSRAAHLSPGKSPITSSVTPHLPRVWKGKKEEKKNKSARTELRITSKRVTVTYQGSVKAEICGSSAIGVCVTLCEAQHPCTERGVTDQQNKEEEFF